MSRSRYAIGREFEYRVRNDMANHGFIAVRSPASKSPTDVYCIGVGVNVFVQCKTNGKLPMREWNRFWAQCKSVDAIPVMAMKGIRGRIRYMLLTGPKERGMRRQPMADWIPIEGGRHEVSRVDGGRDRGKGGNRRQER